MPSPRHAALALAAALLAPTATLACPPPPPMTERLVLATPDGATIPADGAILVNVIEEMHFSGPTDDGAGDATLTVRIAGGAALPPTIEYPAVGLQRWRLPAGKAARELEVVDASGAVIAHLHQTAAGVTAALPVPKLKRVTSDLGADQRGPSYGVPASHAVFELASTPAGLTLITESVDGGAWFAPAVPTNGRVVRDTYAGKGCGGGPSPVAAGTRLRFAWLATDGRMSAWTKPITVKHGTGRDRNGR